MVIMMFSCTSKPNYPETFGVYHLSSGEYVELKARSVEKKRKNYGKPSAGQLGGSRMSVLRDPRFGKNHIVSSYYVDGKDPVIVSVDIFKKDGFVLVGESISECELIKVPNKVNGKDNSLGEIYFKIVDSWGKKNFASKDVLELKQKIVSENVYQLLPDVDIQPGIYLLQYKTNGQQLKNKLVPFFVK
jgi:hypothetical protein